MEQSGRIPETEKTRHCTVIRTGSGFVAETPGVNTGMIFIPFKHPGGTISKNRRPLRVAAKIIVKSMMFNIGFINDIKPEFITEVI